MIMGTTNVMSRLPKWWDCSRLEVLARVVKLVDTWDLKNPARVRV